MHNRNTLYRAIEIAREEGLKTLGIQSVHKIMDQIRSKPILSHTYNLISPLYYRRKFRSEHLITHGNYIDPIKLVYVDPNSISTFSGRFDCSGRKLEMIGQVKDGDWDINSNEISPNPHSRKLLYADHFEESIWFKSIENHFCNGADWEETEFIEAVIDIVNSGESYYHKSESIDDIKKRCSMLDDIYESLKVDGYKLQRELHPEKSLPKRFANEVLVDIGRDGDLLFVDGRHRLAFAKLLDLQSIPVGIVVRHKDWLNERKEYIGQGRTKDHPDLAEFSDELESTVP